MQDRYLGAWKHPTTTTTPHLSLETPLVNQNGMTSCVMAGKAWGRPNPVFVLKLIGGFVDDEVFEECTGPPM